MLFHCVHLEQRMDVLHTILPRTQEKQDLQSTIFGTSYSSFTENSDRAKIFLKLSETLLGEFSVDSFKIALFTCGHVGGHTGLSAIGGMQSNFSHAAEVWQWLPLYFLQK